MNFKPVQSKLIPVRKRHIHGLNEPDYVAAEGEFPGVVFDPMKLGDPVVLRIVTKVTALRGQRSCSFETWTPAVCARRGKDRAFKTWRRNLWREADQHFFTCITLYRVAVAWRSRVAALKADYESREELEAAL